ncbi:MAG: T9SS type A sorting domain-containing protein [Bacteroidota bacterium]
MVPCDPFGVDSSPANVRKASLRAPPHPLEAIDLRARGKAKFAPLLCDPGVLGQAKVDGDLLALGRIRRHRDARHELDPARVFGPKAFTRGPLERSHMEVMDVDNDGDPDLVVAGEFQRNLLFFNDGSGVFAEDPARLFPEKNTIDGFPGEDSEDIVFADFDQDGDPDVLFVSEDSNFHELLVNDGNGLFTFITYEFPVSAGNAVAVLDLNNDDYPDVIVGNNGQNQVFINDQDLTFTEDASRWPVNTEGTQDLKLIDLDNDGDMDIVEGIDLGSNNILINTNGVFAEDNARLPNTGLTLETRKITLGDVDDDGDDDIFVSTVNFTGAGDLQNRLYINDGNGFYTDATTTQLPGYQQQTLDAVFVDYDQDDDLDLISVDFQNPGTNYHAFENDGNGSFTEDTTVFESFTLQRGISILAADLNLDTFVDLYFGNFQETDDLLLFDPGALSTELFDNSIDIFSYPNPTDGVVIISSVNTMDESELSLELRDVKGQLVKEIEYIGNKVQPLNLTLDLTSFPSGTYFYTLYDGKAIVTDGKIIRK